MNRSTLSLVVAGGAAVALVASGWFLGVHPQLAAAAASKEQRSSIQSTNTETRAELGRLAEQFKSLDAKKTDLAALQASIPSTMDNTAFIKELNTLAQQTGVTITALTFETSKPYTSPVVAEAPAATATASASPSATPSPTATPSGVAAPAPKTDPSITGTNFTVIPVSVAISGSDAQALAFTSGVQNGARLFLVNALSSGTGTGTSGGESLGGSVDAPPTTTSAGKAWTLGGYIYVLDEGGSTTATSTATPAANG
jgi:Tfp pilus assembly protein PilO